MISVDFSVLLLFTLTIICIDTNHIIDADYYYDNIMVRTDIEMQCSNDLHKIYCSFKCRGYNSECYENKCVCVRSNKTPQSYEDSIEKDNIQRSKPDDDRWVEYPEKPVLRMGNDDNVVNVDFEDTAGIADKSDNEATVCSNLKAARDCVKRCLLEGKLAHCSSVQICYCSNEYLDQGKKLNVSEIVSQSSDILKQFDPEIIAELRDTPKVELLRYLEKPDTESEVIDAVSISGDAEDGSQENQENAAETNIQTNTDVNEVENIFNNLISDADTANNAENNAESNAEDNIKFKSEDFEKNNIENSIDKPEDNQQTNTEKDVEASVESNTENSEEIEAEVNAKNGFEAEIIPRVEVNLDSNTDINAQRSVENNIEDSIIDVGKGAGASRLLLIT